MHVIACNEIYYIVLQIHYMSLHRGGFADDSNLPLSASRDSAVPPSQGLSRGRAAAEPRWPQCGRARTGRRAAGPGAPGSLRLTWRSAWETEGPGRHGHGYDRDRRSGAGPACQPDWPGDPSLIRPAGGRAAGGSRPSPRPPGRDPRIHLQTESFRVHCVQKSAICAGIGTIDQYV